MSKARLFVKRNASTILTCVGAVGVVATSVATVKATTKAVRLLEEAEKQKGEELSKTEVVKITWPVYVPPVLIGASTIACLFGANILSKHQQAAIASAYALLDSSYKEYKTKVEELYGENANANVRDEIAKDKYEENDISVESEDKQLFFDEFSGRYFESTLLAVQSAEYDINRDLVMRDYATLNEFYDYLGLAPIESGDELGWSTGMNFDYYWQVWIDFSHHKVTMDDGLECYIISMMSEPNLSWSDY